DRRRRHRSTAVRSSRNHREPPARTLPKQRRERPDRSVWEPDGMELLLLAAPAPADFRSQTRPESVPQRLEDDRLSALAGGSNCRTIPRAAADLVDEGTSGSDRAFYLV